jgi:hypothetical protein
MPATDPTPKPDLPQPEPLLPALFTRPSAHLWFWALPIALLLLLSFRGYGVV